MAEVEVHLRKRYQCSACRRSSSSRKVMERHVSEGCIKDPGTHACATCSHQGVDEYDGYYCSLGLLKTASVESSDPFSVPDERPPTFLKHCPEWASVGG